MQNDKVEVEGGLFWDFGALTHTMEGFLQALALNIWVPAELLTPPNYVDSNHFGVVILYTQEAGFLALSPAKG